MNGLEQRSNCNALTTAQIVTQFGNHPFKLGKNDVDRLAVVRFSNARRGIAASCFDAQPDELPWRRHAIYHGQQGIQKQLAIARCGTIGATSGCQFVTGTWRTICCNIRLRTLPSSAAILKLASIAAATQSRKTRVRRSVFAISCEHCLLTSAAKEPRIVRQEIALDPTPKRFKRRARDASKVLVIAAIVDKKQFKWLEEQLSGFDRDELSRLAARGMMRRNSCKTRSPPATADSATQHAALKFADQQRSRSRRELAQKFPQSFDGRFDARHPRLYLNPSPSA